LKIATHADRSRRRRAFHSRRGPRCASGSPHLTFLFAAGDHGICGEPISTSASVFFFVAGTARCNLRSLPLSVYVGKSTFAAAHACSGLNRRTETGKPKSFGAISALRCRCPPILTRRSGAWHPDGRRLDSDTLNPAMGAVSDFTDFVRTPSASLTVNVPSSHHTRVNVRQNTNKNNEFRMG